MEDGLGVDIDGPATEVLLAEAADLALERHGLELLREGDLLELHLVDASVGGAEQDGGRGEESSLHDGQQAGCAAGMGMGMGMGVVLGESADGTRDRQRCMW